LPQPKKKAKAGNRKLAFASATRRGEGAVPPLLDNERNRAGRDSFK